MMTLSSRFSGIAIVCFVLLWIGVHIPAVLYGTKDIPLHQTYVGDEQSPVNGALHILKNKDIFAFKDLKTVYYGPVFSFITTPIVALDFIEKKLFDAVASADDYKNFLLWDWGGIVRKLRLIAVLCGVIGVFGLYKLLRTRIVNPSGSKLAVYGGCMLLAVNFYYFEYTSFWKHWALIIPILIWQFYFLIRYVESMYARRYLVYSAVLFFMSFGISYLGLLFQIMWLPLLWQLYQQRHYRILRELVYYFVTLLACITIVVAWHPRAFWRITGLVGTDIVDADQGIYSAEKSMYGLSFVYYGVLIVKNHLALIIGAIVAYGVVLKSNKWDMVKVWFLPMALVTSTTFIIFGLMSHHEGRYCLPVIVTLVIMAACIFANYITCKREVVFNWVITICIAVYVVYHVVHIGIWTRYMVDGPVEERIIRTINELQDKNKNIRTIAIQFYLFGSVHTKAAYADFASSTGKDNLNLYKEIARAALPLDRNALNVYYIRPDNKRAYDFNYHNTFDHIIYKIEQQTWLNQFDFFDEDLTRLWWYDQFMSQYIFIK